MDSESNDPVSESELDPEEEHVLDEPTPAPQPPGTVETLVAGRQRRSTAGNRLQSLLDKEADAEDTLFLEDEDDVEFQVKGKEDLEDYFLESSSESEDEDAGAGKEDEGEQEIRMAEKEERRNKKRKAHDAFMKPQRVTAPVKKVTIRDEQAAATTPTEEYTALTRPRKKSERVSWVPDFTATRASNRTLSLQNRSDTMRKLEESEKRRLHTIALMEAAAAKKNKQNPKRQMTQEERLAEAKITEEKNLKSLNRWEEEEKGRLEEQRRKLAALQNRKLEGPVITFWSGRAEWDARGILMRVGKGLIEVIEPGKEDKAKSKKKAAKTKVRKEEEEPPRAESISESVEESTKDTPSQADTPSNTITVQPSTTPTRPIPFTPPPHSRPLTLLDRKDIPTFLDGILDFAALPDPATATRMTHPATMTEGESQLVLPAAPEPEPERELSTRNLVVLEDFDPDAVRTAQGVMRILFPNEARRTWPTAKSHCVITHMPARFLDPLTGMPYANLYAYRELRRILSGEIRWCSLLGAYVGTKGSAAKGVPEGFE